MARRPKTKRLRPATKVQAVSEPPGREDTQAVAAVVSESASSEQPKVMAISGPTSPEDPQ